ncbi:MAG: UDP-2,3-diacylglucosamine diphosphatase LpxI [Gemmataceae bacterium]
MTEQTAFAPTPQLLLGQSSGVVGLVAGWGRFPVSFAEKARQMGLRVACVGLTDSADPCLADLSWKFTWAGPVQVGRMIRFFRRHGAYRLVMAGKVQKADLLYRPWKILSLRPDWRGFHAWYFRKRRDHKDDSLLLAFIDEFALDDMHFASALDLCPELLVKPGVLTRRQPTSSEYEDIQFGWEMAKEMGRLDVGQSVAIKDKAVLAVEAIEGTDRAILRAGELCRVGGFTVVKVAKPNQDMRFDVPTVGVQTIQTIQQARGRVLAIEAERTIVLDQQETIALADRLGISIVVLRG